MPALGPRSRNIFPVRFSGCSVHGTEKAEGRGSFSVSHASKPTGAPENYSEPAVVASDWVSDWVATPIPLGPPLRVGVHAAGEVETWASERRLCQLPSCQAGLRRQVCRLRQVRVAGSDRLRRSRPVPARLATFGPACSLQDEPGRLAASRRSDWPRRRAGLLARGGERGPEEKIESTIACGPTTLVKNHYSVPVEWVNLHELNDDFAIFKAWPSEQNRVAATHLLAVPELKWAKEEGGLFYLARSEYDLACGQV